MRERILQVLEKAGKMQINLLSKAARENLTDKIINAIYNYKEAEDVPVPGYGEITNGK